VTLPQNIEDAPSRLSRLAALDTTASGILDSARRHDAGSTMDAPQAHDAFISYSRKNRDFAVRLEKALEDYRPPKDLGVPQRHLEIFRDETDFTGVEYHQSVEAHLKSSAKLIVICSPDARKSPYVGDEIRRFAQASGPANIIPVLVAGVPNNEAGFGNDAAMAFPDALCAVLEMPLATSYLGFGARGDRVNRGGYEGAWYSLLANLYGLPRSVVEQRDKRRQARRRRTMATAAVIALTVLTALLVLTFFSRQEAVRQRTTAEAREQANRRLLYVANMNLAHRAFDEGDIRRGYDLLRVHLPVSGEAPAEDLRSFFWFYLWRLNAQDLAPLQAPAGGRIGAVAFSPDGQTLAAGGSGNIVTLWSVSQRRRLVALPEQESPISSVAFSHDGRILATGAADGRVKLWDVLSGKEIAPLERQRGGVFWVLFSPDRAHVATASAGGDVRVWHLPTRMPIATLTGHEAWGRVSAAAFSRDGRRLATAGWDGTTRLWDTARYDHSPLVLWKHQEPVRAVAFSRDDRVLATGSDDDTVKLWDVASGKELQTLTEHTSDVTAIAFPPGADTLATASHERALIVKLWAKQDGVSYTRVLQLEGRAGDVASTVFAPDTAVLATGGAETVRLWDLWRRPELAALRGHRSAVWSVAFSEDGRTLATGSGDGTAKLWDVHTRRERATVPMAGTLTVSSVALSLDGTTLVMGSRDRPAALWHAASGQEPAALGEPGDTSGAVALSPDGDTVVTANADGTVRLWSARTRQKIDTLAGHEGRVSSLAFSADGKALATGGYDDRSIRVWDLPARRLRAALGKHDNALTSLAFSRDGTVLATASSDRTVRLWDATTGRPLATFVGHRDSVLSVAFSSDGATLASGANDGIVKLWDLRTRQELATLAGRVSVPALQFSREGKVLALGFGDNTVGLWYGDAEPPRP
jgi:WD40 repeat protein